MNENIFPIFVALLYGLMPIWITFVLNPLWSINKRRIIIIVLVLSNILFYSFLFTKSTPRSFADPFARPIAMVLLILYWIILIYRAYQLWFRQKD